MQPEISQQLKTRKLETLDDLKPEIIATGNIGCITQLGRKAGTPVIHTVQLLDWAYGGERPQGL